MNSEIKQEVLFQDPIGIRLRQGREAAGLTVEQVGQQLKLPVAIVKAMEIDDWARLGAPVYVRSYLGSYLRLVGLPPALCEQAAQTKAAPALVAMGTQSGVRRTLDHSLRNLVYLVMTAVLVIPVVLVARYYQAGSKPELLALDAGALPAPAPAPSRPAASTTPLPAVVPAPETAAVDSSPGEIPSANTAAVATDAAHPAPVMASMAPFQPAVASPGELLLTFKGESWLEVIDGQGGRLERGLVNAGTERRYAPGQVARITLGRADAVDVSFAGKAVDTTPYRAANVARFTVSSSGEPAPAGN
ncbi:MAG: helix-turn-helix domain-containing protein [Arenimonas sp.]|nr:helix-turn-helix domain-containing protein [Arenimonas sp.]